MYKQLLRDAGLKITHARLEVLHLLTKTKKPQNISQIKQKTKKIDTVTLYRMMQTFTEKGIVRSVHICAGQKFFELTALPHHHHIVCKKCGMIEDINNCYLENTINRVVKSSNSFNKITQHTFELVGICKKCK